MNSRNTTTLQYRRKAIGLAIGCCVLITAPCVGESKVTDDRKEIARPILEIPHDNAINFVLYNRAGDLLVTGSYYGVFRIFDATNGKEIVHWHTEDSEFSSLAWSPDGRIIAIASLGGKTTVFRASDGRMLWTFPGTADSLSFSPDGKSLAVGQSNNVCYIDVLETATGKLIATLDVTEAGGETAEVLYSSDGKKFAWHDQTIKILDATTGKKILECEDSGALFSLLAQSKNDKLIAATFSPDENPEGGPLRCMIRIWNAETGKKKAILLGHEGRIHSLDFSPDSKLLASGAGGDPQRGELAIWDVVKEKRLCFIQNAHARSINALSFSPDGKRLATGGGDGRLKIWDVKKLFGEK